MARKMWGEFLSHRYRPYIIVLIYLVISVLWIFFSDRAVSSLFVDPEVITAVQTYKGLAFVFASALLLFALIRSSITNISRSEERYRSALDGMLEGCQIIGRDWRYRYLNSAAVTHSHKAEKELIGRTITEAYPGIESTKLFSALRDCMETHVPKRIENLFSYPDGSEGWFELSIEPVPEGLFILSLDITERKRAEATLRESEGRYRALIDNSNDAILLTSPDDGAIFQANPAACRMFGYTEAELMQIGRDGVIDPDETRLAPALEERRRTGIFRGELSFRRQDGRIFPGEITTALFRDKDGKFKTSMIVRDITERKQMEEHLLITDRLAAIGELASGIAHELNNPLTGIIGLSELVLKEDIPEEVREDIEMIHSEACRSAKIVRNLLTFARKHKMESQEVEIGEVVRSALELRAYDLKINNIETVMQFDPALPKVKADAFQLQQVFLNIVINAEYFMIQAHGKGKITITTESASGMVRISFCDNGPGIPERQLKHIFDPFFTTKEVGKGTGLGLSICHGIVTGQGGKIHAENRQGGGAVFFIELPVCEEQPAGTE